MIRTTSSTLCIKPGTKVLIHSTMNLESPNFLDKLHLLTLLVTWNAPRNLKILKEYGSISSLVMMTISRTRMTILRTTPPKTTRFQTAMDNNKVSNSRLIPVSIRETFGKSKVLMSEFSSV